MGRMLCIPGGYLALPHAAMLYSHGEIVGCSKAAVKIVCDALQCIFLHVGTCTPDFGISQYILSHSQTVFSIRGI